MKKSLTILTLLSAVFSFTPAIAQNQCLAQLNQHVSNQQLNLNACNLQSGDIPTVISYLNTHQAITSLNLRDNQIDDKGAMTLATGLAVAKLDMGKNNLTDVGASALAQNTKINSLAVDLQHNVDGKIGDRTATAFAENANLTELAIGGNDAISQEGQLALVTTDHLTKLKLRTNVDHAVLTALSSNHTLTKISVGINHHQKLIASNQQILKSKHVNKA